MVSVIVLAAGLSTRMGTHNKLLLDYKKKPVIEIIVETILAAGIKEVVIVTGHESEKIQKILEELPVRFVHNPRYQEGMTSSIQQGVRQAGGNGYMICLSDMVTISALEYKYLNENFEKIFLQDNRCICLPVYKKQKGNPVIFSAYYKELILKYQEQEGCKAIVQSNKEHVYTIEMNEPHVLEDFDNPEDYQRLFNR